MKHLTGFLALFLFAVLPLSAADLSDLTYSTTGGEVTITDCDTSASGTLVIPDSIDGNPVINIGNSAFRGCTLLTSVSIPDSVTSIGASSFRECTSLTSVTVPDGLSSIGFAAFRDCSSLTSITIPDPVTRIQDSTFRSCSSLTSITIPHGVTEIGFAAFRDCTSLTSVTFLGPAPTVLSDAFRDVADTATAHVKDRFADGYPRLGGKWEGLSVRIFVSNPIVETTIIGSGTIEGAGSFPDGTSITLTANPAPGRVFVAWTGDASGAENPLPLTVTRDLRIGAVFIEPAAVGLVTKENYDEVVAERDTRYTEEQIRALSPDYTMGLNEAGNVEVKISFIASSDATNFAPFPVTADSLTVVDGKICMELPPDEGAFFYRFRIE